MSGYLASLPPQWTEFIRERGLSDSNFRQVCILIGLYAHRNDKTGVCRPSIDRLSRMLGMRKQFVLDGVDRLQKLNWLSYKTIPAANGRFMNEYLLESYNNVERAFVFSSKILTSGLWTFLTPSQQKTWLMLRAHAVHGANIIADAFCGGSEAEPQDDILDYLNEGWHWKDFWFIPDHIIAPSAWAEKLYITHRTFTESVHRLANLGMLAPADHIAEDSERGLVLIVEPQPPSTAEWKAHQRTFTARLANKDSKQSSFATKRLLTSLKKSCNSSPLCNQSTNSVPAKQE